MIRLLVLFALGMVCSINQVRAQYLDPRDWYNDDQEWVRIGTIYDNMHEVNADELLSIGFPSVPVNPNQLKLYLNGVEQPIEVISQNNQVFNIGDKIRFMGKRNDGTIEKYAYSNNGEDQASDYFSLYSDTTYFWLTYSDSPGLRYQEVDAPESINSTFRGYRDTVHVEADVPNTYYIGYDSFAELSTYGESEGYYFYDGNLASTSIWPVSFKPSISDLVRVDSTIYITGRMASQSNGNRAMRINLLHSRNGSIAYHRIGSTSWSGKGGAVVTGSVSPVRLIDYEELDIIFQAVNQNEGIDFSNPHLMLFDWYKYSYYRGFNVPNNIAQRTFWLKPDGANAVQFENIPNEDTIKVYSPTSGELFYTSKDTTENTATFFDNTIAEKNHQYVIVRNQFYRPIETLKKVAVDTSILSESNEGEFLILTRPLFKQQAQVYANYRASKSQITSKVVLADDVWELFGQGSITPKAIQDFIHYASENWAKPPKYVFILADGNLQNRFTQVGTTEIPSFGYPSSDTWYGLNKTSPNDFIPRVSVGRLTVQSQSEVIAYLAKVSQYEGTRSELEPWQKRVTLLSGGFDTGERELLLNHNLRLATVATNSVIAADTIIVGKKSNQPLDESSRADLGEIINSGTFLLQFFGHSSPDSWDLLTDNPDAYQNQGRLSIVLSLGCYSGLFTSSTNRIISEQFVFAPNAAIAFIGGSGQGRPSSLQTYSNQFYKEIFEDTVQVLGDVDRLSKLHMATRFFSVPVLDLALIMNTNVIGDPSLEMAYPRDVDYRFDFTAVEFNPSQPNISDSLMQITANIRNLGILPTSESVLSISHLRPSLPSKQYEITIPPIRTVENFTIDIDLEDEDTGLHQFDLSIDAQGQIDEFSELNNSFQTDQLVYSTGADLIYPTDFGVHDTTKPLFIVSSPSIIDQELIQIQLDTLDSFSEPIADSTILGQQLNIQWQPNISLKHNKEYYWRAKVVKEDEDNWRTSSFLVDTTKTGTWWQQKPRRFTSNNFSSSLSYQDSTFSFNSVDLEIRTSTLSWTLANQSTYANYPASSFVNGEQMGRLSISFFMIVVNGLTGEIRNGIDSQGIPRGQGYAVHSGQYRSPTDGLLSRAQFIQDLNAVRPGDYVILRVRHQGLVSPNTPIIFGNNDALAVALRSVGGFRAAGGVNGSNSIGLLPNFGYILFGKKFASVADYDPNQVSEYIIQNGIIEADTVLTFNSSQGSMTSELIGPVKAWNQFQASLDNVSATGKIFFDLYGQSSRNANPTRLQVANPTGLLSNVETNISSIDANTYPYMRIIARFENEDRRAPQLNELFVSYEPVPELALDAFSARVEADTVEEGYDYSFNIPVSNLGLTDADTIIVSYTDVYKPLNQSIIPTLIKLDTLVNIQSFNNASNINALKKLSNVIVPTVSKQGDHELQVRFSNFNDQFSYNNYYSRNFFVTADSISPQVEVFVDNRFAPPLDQPITDKSDPTLPYVSANPTVEVYFSDQNPFLRLQDSTSFEIRLFTSDQTDYQSFNYLNSEIEFVPASSTGRNEAYIEFKPDLTSYADTAISLQILARDFTGNIAENGVNGYFISFKISNAEGMTSFYPYPNPMSNFTNFAFELQGQNISAIEKLQLKIYTPSGRLVKVTDLLENQNLLNDGQLRVGWNIYRWDGRDDDGDKLATGVYLYHVDFRANGNQIEVNNKKSIEKLVIIR